MIISHRGHYNGTPENTIPAFEEVLKLKGHLEGELALHPIPYKILLPFLKKCRMNTQYLFRNSLKIFRYYFPNDLKKRFF